MQTVFSVFLFFGLFFFVGRVSAADFRTSYNIEYFIRENDLQHYTKTSYTISLTNLQPNLIVKKFTLSFPISFAVGNIVAKDDRGVIVPEIVNKDRTIEVSFAFNDPKPGLNEINNLYLDFLQKNIFQENGSLWEVLIPTLQNKEGDTHSVTVYLPPGQHRKLSLSKPVPDLVTFDKVVWNNVTGASIYAVFGDVQQYNMDLIYHISNPNPYRVYTDVAFPPDTLYQQIVVDSIVPRPDSVYSDSDGNYMGRYYLGVNEQKQVEFKGEAKVYTTPRSDYRVFAENQFETQKKTLFDVQPLWKLNNETPIKSSDIKDHFDYTLQTLAYNFNRVIKGNSRMGAQDALRFPDQAVCTEYSDVLIASARQRGIYVREVQGFAFANEHELRPIQQQSDILHSWVEYYDTQRRIWIPIDPTWQDTSGIDYFHSFDFNHIVFAIHGKKADYPFPAGSYKSDPNEKDVTIMPTTENIGINKSIAAELSTIPLPDANDSFTIDLTVQNRGNTSQWNISLGISAENAKVQDQTVIIDKLVPYEKKKISIPFKPKSSLLCQDVSFTVILGGDTLIQEKIKVPTILTTLKQYLTPILFIFIGLIVLIALLKKRGNKDELV